LTSPTLDCNSSIYQPVKQIEPYQGYTSLCTNRPQRFPQPEYRDWYSPTGMKKQDDYGSTCESLTVTTTVSGCYPGKLPGELLEHFTDLLGGQSLLLKPLTRLDNSLALSSVWVKTIQLFYKPFRIRKVC
jgi:hypothetical protein